MEVHPRMIWNFRKFRQFKSFRMCRKCRRFREFRQLRRDQMRREGATRDEARQHDDAISDVVKICHGTTCAESR